MDNGWEWQALRDLSIDSAGGDVLVTNAEHWDNEEWQRNTLESNSLSSGPLPLCSFLGVSSSCALDCILCSFPGVSSLRSSDCMAEHPLFNKTSRLETSMILALGVVEKDFTFSSLVDGETEDNCWSNALRYKERRCCSRYTTSNSNSAISLINSVAGWSYKSYTRLKGWQTESNPWTNRANQRLKLTLESNHI